MSLIIDNLNFSYGDKKVLDSISYNFNIGEMTIIAGPNGSGKTTLVKALMSHIKTDKNRILLNDRDIHSYSLTKRSQLIGYVAQYSSHDFDFSVYEIVEMGRFPFKKEWNNIKDQEAIITALKNTDTYKFRDRSITTLSGGELQRVMLARALAGEPKFLVLDEPSSNLDILHNIEMMKLLNKLTKTIGLTTILIIHDVNSMLHYGDNIIMLKNGKLELSGKIKDILIPPNLKHIYGIESKILTDDSGFNHIVTI